MLTVDDVMKICGVCRRSAYAIMRRVGAVDLNKGTGKRPILRIHADALDRLLEPQKNPARYSAGFDSRGKLERRHA